MPNNFIKWLIMASSEHTTLLATFRLADNVLTYIDKQTYRMNREQAKNSTLDLILTQCINLASTFIDKFYPHNNIAIRFDNIINTKDDANVPLDTLILAEPLTPDDMDEKIKEELCFLLKKFMDSILATEREIFAVDSPSAFTPEQSNFIDEYTTNTIIENNGKSIGKPFICVIGGDNSLEIPVQGAFKNPVNQNTGKKTDDTFFALSDGAKGSGMLVFLKRVGATNKQVSGMAKEFIAERPSHTRIASIAYASDYPLVKVTAYEKADDKGKIRSYVKEISQASEKNLEAFELTLTD